MSSNRANGRQATRQGSRQADLASIHMAKAELGWSEDEYRDIMGTVCGGVRSSALLDFAGRQRFLAHQRACLATLKGISHAPRTRLVKGPLSGPQKRMWALWMQVVDAKLAEHRTMAALAAFAQRQTHVARIEWLNAAQETLVIESLKAWLKRGGSDGAQG